MFLVTAVVYFIGAFVLFFFCETKLEPWAVGNQKSKPEEEEEGFIELKQ